MKKNIITISESGVVSVSGNIQMQDFEIAELFGVMIPTICSHVRAILKTGIATGDYTHGATLVYCNFLSNYNGLGRHEQRRNNYIPNSRWQHLA